MRLPQFNEYGKHFGNSWTHLRQANNLVLHQTSCLKYVFGIYLGETRRNLFSTY